jgi:2-polyprenyl-3-methyl-5-hydroxy-6-metoxy-1,4-benzoquinol methylase
VLGRISGAFGASQPIERTSTWFVWHSGLVQRGMAVLDLACGTGRHALAAAELGAAVTAVDADASKLKAGRRAADQRKVTIEWVQADLERYQLRESAYDLVMAFNYLDRHRMTDILRTVRPGGYLLAETFLETQRQLGWGPTAPEHLLRTGELTRLVRPLEVVQAREALDFHAGRPMSVASVLAQRVVE